MAEEPEVKKQEDTKEGPKAFAMTMDVMIRAKSPDFRTKVDLDRKELQMIISALGITADLLQQGNNKKLEAMRDRAGEYQELASYIDRLYELARKEAYEKMGLGTWLKTTTEARGLIHAHTLQIRTTTNG